MINASKLGGFHGVYDPLRELQGHGVVASPVQMASFADRAESVCHFSRDGIQGVFWGELYESSAAEKTLALTERILTAYLTHGVDFAGHLDGVFALAIWDSHEQRLLLCRDSSAARGLYYHQDRQGRIHFSTQLGYLVRQSRPRFCRTGLWEYLRFLEVAPPNTLYEDIYALEAGYRLTVRDGTLEVHPVPIACDPYPDATGFEDAVTQLDVLLQKSIRARMAGSEPVGAFLSGGLDSALICALGRKIGRPPAGAVTVGFNEARYDESGLAAGIAAHLGIPHRVLRYGHSDYLGAMRRLYEGSDQPSADPSGLLTLLAFEFCRDHYAAMLDGSGAEALVGIMPPRYIRMAIQCSARIPKAPRHFLAAALKPLPVLGAYAPLFDFDDAEELLIRWRGFPRKELEDIFGEPVSFSGTRFYKAFREFPAGAHFERYTALIGVLTDDRIHHAASLTGLPVRFPFIDRRIEGYVKALPQAWRSTVTSEKRILRAVLARHLPSSLWDVPKHGFDFPFQDFLSADNYALVNQYLDSAESPLLGLFDRSLLNSYAGKFRAGDAGVNFRVWALVVLSMWLESHEPVAVPEQAAKSIAFRGRVG